MAFLPAPGFVNKPHFDSKCLLSARTPRFLGARGRAQAVYSQSGPPRAILAGLPSDATSLLSAAKFNDAGLIPAIAQQWDTGEVLMLAWMNAESINESVRTGQAVYYSRSRKGLWRKGESSGQTQDLRSILLDCDGDTVLLQVHQHGVACHTGRRSCFYTAFDGENGQAREISEVIIAPQVLYRKPQQ